MIVRELDEQLESEIKQKTHRVRFSTSNVQQMLEKRPTHRLYLKAIQVANEFSEIEAIYRENYPEEPLFKKITKQTVDNMQNHARGFNEVIRGTTSSDHREILLRKSIVQNKWIQRCLRGSFIPKFKWELNIDMTFFRTMILTALKYGREANTQVDL